MNTAPRVLGVTDVETTVDGAGRGAPSGLSRTQRDDRPARRPRGGQRTRALRDRGRLARAASDAAGRVPPQPTTETRSLRDPVRAHRARHHRARRRREGPVRDLRAQVDRHGGCRWRVRAAQRRQVRAPGEERSAEPEPAALPDVPRQDRRSRHPPLHLRVPPVRERRSRQGRPRRLPAQQPAADHRRGAGRQLRGGRRRGRHHRDREAGRARRRGGAAALREPRAPDHDGAARRPAPPHRARDRPSRAALRGCAISGGSSSDRSRSRRSCWRIEP